MTADSLMLAFILKIKYGLCDVVMGILASCKPQTIGRLLNKFRYFLRHPLCLVIITQSISNLLALLR